VKKALGIAAAILACPEMLLPSGTRLEDIPPEALQEAKNVPDRVTACAIIGNAVSNLRACAACQAETGLNPVTCGWEPFAGSCLGWARARRS
jgi:hypothetical protein